MKFKTIIAASLLTVASLTAIATPTPIELTGSATDGYSGSFSGNGASNVFTFDLTGIKGVLSVFLQATATSVNKSGYDISAALLDGESFSAITNSAPTGKFKSTADDWQYTVENITAGTHTIEVDGTSFKGQSFTGLIGVDAVPVTPVPELETYAMLLAGLGLIGTVVSRRKIN